MSSYMCCQWWILFSCSLAAVLQHHMHVWAVLLNLCAAMVGVGPRRLQDCTWQRAFKCARWCRRGGIRCVSCVFRCAQIRTLHCYFGWAIWIKCSVLGFVISQPWFWRSRVSVQNLHKTFYFLFKYALTLNLKPVRFNYLLQPPNFFVIIILYLILLL